MPKNALVVEILNKMKDKGESKKSDKEMDSELAEGMDLNKEALSDLANDVFTAIEEKDADMLIETLKELLELL